MTENFFKDVFFDLKPKVSPNEYSALDLAYIGDAVFEICVRAFVLQNGNIPVNKLHKISSGFVNAHSQALMFEKIKDILSEKEFAVMKRGRNAKSLTTAKNASVTDYRHATGLEALFGYLFLMGENDRILELFNICIKKENYCEK